MRAFRIPLLLPLLGLLWLVTTGSMCPNDGPTNTNGRSADVGGYMEISPSSPRPMEPITLNAAALETTGNPDAFSTWAFAVYRGGEVAPTLDDVYQPGSNRLVEYIREEDPWGPGESATQRIVNLPRGGYTVAYYMSASTQFNTANRVAIQTFNVWDCGHFSTAQTRGYPDTLTAGNGPTLDFRNLPDTGHRFSPVPVEESGKIRAFIDEPVNFHLGVVHLGGEPSYLYQLLDVDEDLGLSVSATGLVSGTPRAGSEGEHWMRVLISDSCEGPWFVEYQIPVIVTNALCPIPVFPFSTELPVASLNQPYFAAIAPTGGTPPFTLEHTGGPMPPGLTVTNAGISGTPTTLGQFQISIQATDSCVLDDPREAIGLFNIEVLDPANCPTLSVNPFSPSNGQVGAPYSSFLGIGAGFPPLTITLTSGSLPPGLVINSATKRVEGTPTSAGTFNFGLSVGDSCDPQQTGSTNLTITIDGAPACAAAPDIQTTGLPSGTAGTAYSTALTATGGEGALSFTVIADSLPPGLSLTTGGTLSGTPTTEGTFPFTVQALDSCVPAQSDTQVLSVTIAAGGICAAAPDLQITGLLSGTVGTPYSIGISASGGEGTLTYSVIANGLPPGLTLTPGGTISGIPTAEGTFPFTLQVADSCVPPQTDSQAVSITVNGAMVCALPPDLQITGLPGGTVATAYDVGLSASNGHGTLSYSVISGAIPDGLTLFPEGEIAGTPTLDGTFNFTLQVTDQCIPQQSDTQAVSITIVPNGSSCNPLNLSPLTVQDATVGTFYEHFFGEWVNGGESPYQFFVQAPTQPPPGMSMDQNTGTLSGTPTTPGEYQFIFQVIDSCDPFQSASDVVTLTVN